MDEGLKLILLFDFYGQLLTKRQYEIMDMHYNNDYSLGEIALILNISRQGVYDSVKKAKIVLEEYENKLKLLNRFLMMKQEFSEIAKGLQSIDINNLSDRDKNKIESIRNNISSIMKIL